MTERDFKTLAQNLTGSMLKGSVDGSLIDEILADEGKPIKLSQFNELLLLVNKDRVEKPFFDYFFGPNCSVGTLAQGVERFQIAAMLRYGNFIFAYRRLSRLKTRESFVAELGNILNEEHAQLTSFADRSERIVEAMPIKRRDTPLVGYLSPKQLVADSDDGMLMLACLQETGASEWNAFEECLRKAVKSDQSDRVFGRVRKYRKKCPNASPEEFNRQLRKVVPEIKNRADRVEDIQELAKRNQDVFLTWDHMDVYFATSMRKAWEFEDLYDFIAQVTQSALLCDLKLRYFDPTQCFTKSRIDKGLVESLMLKRAKCTVYSVQDVDTLGKDSELAATLAQGKPVIAYVPDKPVDQRAKELTDQELSTILDRLRFVLYADDRFASEVQPADFGLVNEFSQLPEFVYHREFRTSADDEEARMFRQQHSAKLNGICRIIAEAEKRIYDSRANTLRDSHPLGIQVDLSTGVANGVLVVRSPEDCAKLLHAILTRSMRFWIRYDVKEKMWHLREKTSNSIFRVVTENDKINNCFWNFYLRNKTQGATR